MKVPKAPLALGFVLVSGTSVGLLVACGGDDDGTTSTAIEGGAASSTSSSSSSSGAPGDAAAPNDAGTTSSSSGDAGDGGKKALGETCTGGPDCASSVCWKGTQSSYCSLQCTAENAAAVCVTPFDGTCNKQGYCRKP
jgi:hypothetical protein